MFDLEQFIADWRQQMLAAGIQSPVPLEELELHLREEIDRQKQSGLDDEKAFEMATRQIGQAAALKAEFSSAGGFLVWLGKDKHTRINRLLAPLWLAYCCWGFFSIARPIIEVICEQVHARQFVGINFAGLFALLMEWVFLRGFFGSISLLSSKPKGVRTIRFIAFVGLVTAAAQMVMFRSFNATAVVLTAFNIASLFLLRSYQDNDLQPASK